MQVCKSEENGRCIFGERNCWYRHSDKGESFKETQKSNKNNEKDIKENFEVMQRMMKIMENLSQEIKKNQGNKPIEVKDMEKQ